jgi:hypothetical protein
MILNQFAAVLLERVLPHMPQVLQETTKWGKYFTVGKDLKFEGENKVKVRFESQADWSLFPSTELEQIGPEGQMKWKEFYIVLKKMAGKLRHSQEAIEHTAKKNVQVSALKGDMKSWLLTQKLTIDTYLHGNGTGALTTCTGAPTGQVITVANAAELHNGMRITIINSGGVTVVPATYIVMKRTKTDEITVSASTDVTAVDATCTIYWWNAYNTTASRCVLGLQNHLGTANGPQSLYQGYDRTVDEYLSGVAHYNDAAVGTPAAMTEERIFDFATDFMDIQEEVPRMAVTGRGVMKHLLAWRRTENDPIVTMEQQAGSKKGFLFLHDGHEIRIEMEKTMPPNEIWAIERGSMFMYTSGQGFYHPDRTSIYKAMDNALGVEAYYYSFFNTGCRWPRKNGIMHDVLEV